MSETPVEMLRNHGVTAAAVDQLRQLFSNLEHLSASLSHHEANRCDSRDPRPCPWHSDGPLAAHVDDVIAAVNAWCAAGWVERGLLDHPRMDHDAP